DRMCSESECVFELIDTVVKAAGGDMQNGVRIDQWPAKREMMDPYHVVRREKLKVPRPGSTSVPAGLLCADANIQVELITLIPREGLKREVFSSDKIPQPTFGYAQGFNVGDYVFTAAQVPTDWENGIAPEARVNPHFWEGNRIDRETRYTLDNMKLTLEE